MWQARTLSQQLRSRCSTVRLRPVQSISRACSCSSRQLPQLDSKASEALYKKLESFDNVRHLSSKASNASRIPQSNNVDTQELFIQSEFSPGSPIFPPRGARLFQKLISFMRAQYELFGFEEVITPTIYKKSLWRKSGHWDEYAADMFSVRGNKNAALNTGASTTPMKPIAKSDENASEQVTTKSSSQTWAGKTEEYGLKPMNCPGHCLIYKSKIRSYRELPLRYAELSPLHRDEIHGALTGLTRVRRFHQDDGHIFCRDSQIQSEIASTLQFLKNVYTSFNMSDYRLVLSTRPDSFIGEVETWNRAEEQLREALSASGREWTISEGDGAFYGPKIDVILTDRNGKSHQTATIQLDFQLPQRFNLTYIPSESSETPPRPVMIHRAVFGSLERFMALLLDRYRAQPWPFWLNPYQAIVLPLTSDEALLSYAERARRVLSGQEDSDRTRSAIPSNGSINVELDDRPETLSRRVGAARGKNYSIIITVGPREMESERVSVEVYGTEAPAGSDSSKKQLSMTLTECRDYLKALQATFK